MSQYKAVAGPMHIQVGRGDTQSAFTTFADIISREAAGGWEYHSMETVTVTESAGCFLFHPFQPPIPKSYYMLIFVRGGQAREEKAPDPHEIYTQIILRKRGR